jgi:hypothetical protein
MKTVSSKAVRIAKWAAIVVIVLFVVTRIIRFVLQ